MMAIEDHKERRGEPVCIDVDRGKTGTSTLEGTIEWGNDREGYSVATEPSGARFAVEARHMRPDPAGRRPLWERRNPPPADPWLLVCTDAKREFTVGPFDSPEKAEWVRDRMPKHVLHGGSPQTMSYRIVKKSEYSER